MRVGILGVLLLLLLPGCHPCAPPEDAKTEEPQVPEAQKTPVDYYGPPADIILHPPPVPPEIMGPTPLDRLPKK